MAKSSTNFRLLTTDEHFFGMQALMDITDGQCHQSVLIKRDKTSETWSYASGSHKELHPSVLRQLQIPDDLSMPFWYDARDNDLIEFSKWVSKATASLAAQLEQNEVGLAEIRRGGQSDLNERTLALTNERERLRGAVRELMSVLAKMSHTI